MQSNDPEYLKWRALKRIERKLQKPRHLQKLERLDEIIYKKKKRKAFYKFKHYIRWKKMYEKIDISKEEKYLLMELLENQFHYYGYHLPYSIERWVLES